MHRHNCLKIKKKQDDKPGSSEALRIDQDSSAINTLGSRHLFQDVRDSFPHKVRHIETLEPWKPGNAPNTELHSSDPGSAPVPLQCPLPWQKKKKSDAGRKGKYANPVPVSQHFAGLVKLDTVPHTLCPRFDRAVDSGDALTGVSWTSVLVLTLSCRRLSKFYQCQEDDKAVTQGSPVQGRRQRCQQSWPAPRRCTA